MQIEPVIDSTFDHLFKFTQEQVQAFADLTGDNNPVHLDAEYAATTQFKKPIIHGMLGITVFTKVLGTQFPGFGSIYLKQTVEFLRPMFVDTEYRAVFKIVSITLPPKKSPSVELRRWSTRKNFKKAKAPAKIVGALKIFRVLRYFSPSFFLF
jgi:acyl dehydratase